MNYDGRVVGLHLYRHTPTRHPRHTLTLRLAKKIKKIRRSGRVERELGCFDDAYMIDNFGGIERGNNAKPLHIPPTFRETEIDFCGT